MASKDIGEENNARTCSICIESFNHPKLLPCFHTFCFGCLEQYSSKKAVNGKFPCPVCRFEVTLPQNGVNGFRTNFYVEAQTIKDEHARAICDVCEQSAVNRCQECEQLLCEQCTKVHSSLKMSFSHTLTRLGETSRDLPALSNPDFCPKHKGELFRFHCQKCERAICRDCKLTSHESHPTVDLEDVIEVKREELSKMKVECEELVAGFDHTLQKNSANKDKFLNSVLDIEKDINTFADTMISDINAGRQKKLREVRALKKAELDHLVTVESYFEQEKKCLESNISHLSTLLIEGRGADILNTLADMKKRNEKLKYEMIIELKNKMPLTLQVTSVRNAPGGVELGLIDQRFMNESVTFQTPTFNFEATTHTGAIDFLYTASNDQVWVGLRMPFGNCSLILFDYNGVQVESFQMTNERYETTRLEGIFEMLIDLDWGNASQDIQTLMTKISMKYKPYMDSMGDRTCYIDTTEKVVVVTGAKGVKELELSALEMTCAEEFSPRDVCWVSDGKIAIADVGSNSVILFTMGSSELISVKVKCANFEPCAIARTHNRLLVGDVSGNVYGIEIQ